MTDRAKCVALMDGDVVAFQAATVVQKATNWGDGLWTQYANEHEGQGACDNIIEKWRAAVGADKVIVALTHAVNWRNDLLPSYKMKRKGKVKPFLLKQMREYLEQTYEVWERDTLEGDDILGILATASTIKADRKVIISIDKDFGTIPGEFYNPNSGKLREITEEEADRWHLVQALAGDDTDEYYGCPGIGVKRAEEFLAKGVKLVPFEKAITRGKNKGTTRTEWREEPCDDPWACVLSQYEKAGLPESEALIQAQVARICRSSEYDFKAKRVIPWLPHGGHLK